jgi:hypothetical protein
LKANLLSLMYSNLSVDRLQGIELN